MFVCCQRKSDHAAVLSPGSILTRRSDLADGLFTEDAQGMGTIFSIPGTARKNAQVRQTVVLINGLDWSAFNMFMFNKNSRAPKTAAFSPI